MKGRTMKQKQRKKWFTRYVIKATNTVLVESKDHGDKFEVSPGVIAVKCKSEYPRVDKRVRKNKKK